MTEGHSVSRETSASRLVATLFPSSDKDIKRYVDLLATRGAERGLIGPREIPRLWSRHIVNCAVIEAAFDSHSTVADIGSGAGLPGLVLAMARPDLRVTLVEPLLRRSTFLLETVDELELGNVDVVRARAEELHGDRVFGGVTARALAPLGRLVRWCWPLVEEAGQLIAIKGGRAEEELAEHAALIVRLRPAARADVTRYGEEVGAPATTVVRLQSSRNVVQG